MDLNVQAFRLVQKVTEDAPVAESPRRTAGRKGGLKGGIARSKSMSKERRREVAQIASKARWKKTQSTA